MKNCLVQCRHTKKNIHIKSCLVTVFNGINTPIVKQWPFRIKKLNKQINQKYKQTT